MYALRTAIAEAEKPTTTHITWNEAGDRVVNGVAEKQEPVAWVREHKLPLAPGDAFSWVETLVHKTPLYTTPPAAAQRGLNLDPTPISGWGQQSIGMGIPSQTEQEPVAEVKLKTTGGNVGIATVIHEIYSHYREPLRPGDKLYTTPPSAAPVQEPRHIVQSNGRHSPLLTHMMNSRNTPPAAQQEPDAYGYAKRLAVAIWEQHYKATAPQWKPLDDLMGLLTQIDNMTAGLATPPAAQRTWVDLTYEEMNDAYRQSFGLIDSRLVGAQIKFVRAIEAKLKEKNT
jgi:hypothetical protein